MTATPIPRTLAMTLYGDLDVSVIDELPPGRKPIVTQHVYDRSLPSLYDGIRQQVHQGRQVYIVFPLIEESEKIDLKNLEDGFEVLKQVFPEFRLSKVHGKMKPAEKEAEMQRFVKGETQILVATTVIEVGVNVPNASVMVILEAQRFGLAQLHQLRGRVGRGADQSYCILVTCFELSADTRKRIDIMCETNDGFRIAEADLKLRSFRWLATKHKSSSTTTPPAPQNAMRFCGADCVNCAKQTSIGRQFRKKISVKTHK